MFFKNINYNPDKKLIKENEGNILNFVNISTVKTSNSFLHILFSATYAAELKTQKVYLIDRDTDVLVTLIDY